MTQEPLNGFIKVITEWESEGKVGVLAGRYSYSKKSTVASTQINVAVALLLLIQLSCSRQRKNYLTAFFSLFRLKFLQLIR